VKEKYFMVGEAAKKLGVSVRTLQYYDRIGLISPGGQSEGGRRLYSDKDIVRLHQVLSLKHLGFSLEKIKDNLLLLDTPQAVIKAIEAQERQVSEQLKSLTEVQKHLSALKAEVKEMSEVDWYRYAGIIEMLRKQDDHYWVIKYFDEKTFKMASEKFTEESSKEFIEHLESVWDRASALIDEGEPVDGERAKALSKEWWDSITEFTGGDMSILQDIMKFGENADTWQNENWKKKWSKTQDFLGQALGRYFVTAESVITFQESGQEVKG
jgi:DNA-binding transcriptional MerR regulator